MASALPVLSRMAVRNVRKHWRHSLGSMLSIAVGFVAIALFSGYLDDLATRQARMLSLRSMLGDVIVEHADARARAHRDDPWAHQLGDAEQRFVEDQLAAAGAQVRARARFLDITGLASAGRAGAVFLGIGHDVAEGRVLRGELVDDASAGSPLAVGPDDQVLLADGLGAALECLPQQGHPGARPGLTCKRARVQLTATTQAGRLNVVEPRVVGLVGAGLKELDARLLTLPLPLAQRLTDTTTISRYSVQLAPGVDPAAFAARLEAAARARGVPVVATRWQEHPIGDLYRRSMELLDAFRVFVVVIVVAIAAMSVWMTMMRAVAERTREVGMLRSLGFLRRHIVGLFLLEASWLTLASCVAGALATLVLIAACNRSGISYKGGVLADSIPLTVAVVPGVWLSAVAFLSMVAALATWLPARRAARLAIPDALAHV